MARELESDTAASQINSQLEHLCNIDVDSKPSCNRMTGIVCTIGPSCRTVDILQEMMHAGMNIARLNFSHETHKYHEESVKRIREASKRRRNANLRPVAVALDTKGPEIRTGILSGNKDQEILLTAGENVRLTVDDSNKENCCADLIYVNYKNMVNVVKPGSKVFIDDGMICLIVQKINGTNIDCVIENGGKLGSHKGVNLPGTQIDLPAVSEQDKVDLQFAVKHDLDMIFASFIRDANGVREIKRTLGDEGEKIKIIAKIENHQGLVNFDEILRASDGVMVARGDLGIEIPPEEVFLAQKMMIGRANMAGKPVICATQMLESMIQRPRPTRAEVSDVGNAVLDGADCVMLSGETAKGAYPVQAVRMMHLISLEAETAIFHSRFFDEIRRTIPLPASIVTTTAVAAVEASFRCEAKAIIVLTTSGATAGCVASYRPKCPIIAITHCEEVARAMHLYRGIFPVYCAGIIGEDGQDWTVDVDYRVDVGMKAGFQRGCVAPGDPVIIVTGWQAGTGYTNTMRVVIAPESGRRTSITGWTRRDSTSPDVVSFKLPSADEPACFQMTY